MATCTHDNASCEMSSSSPVSLLMSLLTSENLQKHQPLNEAVLGTRDHELRLLDVLIAFGSDVGRQPANRSPLFSCVRNKYRENCRSCRRLLRWGATHIDFVLRAAVALRSSAEVVECLLAEGHADPNASSGFEVPILHDAITRDQDAVVACLLRYGADPERRDRLTTRTALLCTVAVDDSNRTLNASIMTMLLEEYKVNPNAQDDNGMTALMYVCGRDRLGSPKERARWIRILRAHGADPNMVNKEGETAAVLAQRWKVRAGPLLEALEE